MNKKDQWFLNELERQRKCQKYLKWFSNVTLFVLGCLTGMIILSCYLEAQAPVKLIAITTWWGLIKLASDYSAYVIKLKVERLEEITQG